MPIGPDSHRDGAPRWDRSTLHDFGAEEEHDVDPVDEGRLYGDSPPMDDLGDLVDPQNGTYVEDGTHGQGLGQIVEGVGNIIGGSVDMALHPLTIGAAAGYYAAKRGLGSLRRGKGGNEGDSGGGGDFPTPSRPDRGGPTRGSLRPRDTTPPRRDPPLKGPLQRRKPPEPPRRDDPLL